jgi:hypothetical protein
MRFLFAHDTPFQKRVKKEVRIRIKEKGAAKRRGRGAKREWGGKRSMERGRCMPLAEREVYK